MDVLCSDKTGTLTLNKLTVDRSLVEVFTRGADVCLMAARASRVENQDAIDAAIVGMLADPKEVRTVLLIERYLFKDPTMIVFCGICRRERVLKKFTFSHSIPLTRELQSRTSTMKRASGIDPARELLSRFWTWRTTRMQSLHVCMRALLSSLTVVSVRSVWQYRQATISIPLSPKHV